MMKKSFTYVFVVVGILIAACSSDKNQPDISGADTVIKINASVSPLTRVPHINSDGSGNFIEGDAMSVFISGNSFKTINADYIFGSDFTTWNDLGLPIGTQAVVFSSCYPKQEITDNGTFEFNVYTAEYKDLLLSKSQTVEVGTSKPVVLSFSHAMHQLSLKFVSDGSYSAEDIQKLSVTCQAKTTCIVDAVSGVIKGTTDQMANYQAQGNEVLFYLVPQPTEGVKLTFTIDKYTKEYFLKDLFDKLGNSQTELTTGKRCNLTLKVGKDSITLEGGSISVWEDQVTVEGNVVIG